MSSTLSACIIAKNEEKHIGTCLQSLKGVVDEIIVVDTGSTDNTVKIAKEHGAKVYFREWDDDFAAARNEALNHATKDYVIYIDCDEYLAGDEWKSVRKYLNKKYEGFCLLLVNVIGGKKTLAAQTFRIFKNNPKYRFKGKIHEQIIRSILKTHTDKDIGFIQVEIHHTGYDEKEYDIEAKKKRNFLIYEKYPEEEKDGFFYYNLGGEYSRAGLREKALETYIKSYNTKGFDNGYRQYLAIYLTKGLFEFARYKDAIEYSSEFLEEYKEFADLHFLRGTCYYYAGKYTQAMEDIAKYEEYRGNVNYPDFKLGDSNNMSEIINEFKAKIISFNRDSIGLIVDYRESSLLKGNIQKLNEFADKLIVFIDESMKEEERELLRQSYCTLCTSLDEVLENVKDTQYIMYFDRSEYIERGWFIKALEEVNVSGYDYMESMSLDENDMVYIAPRCVKTDLVFKYGLDIFKKPNLENPIIPKEKLMILK